MSDLRRLSTTSWPRLPVRAMARAGIACVLLAISFLGVTDRLRADAVTDFNVAVEWYKQQRWDLAADACEEFLSKYPEHARAPSARLYRAQALVHLRDFNTAREQFRIFLQNAGDHPDRPLAMYRVGECSYFVGDFDAAEMELKEFLETYPDHDLVEWGYIYLGESCLRKQELDVARSAFQASIDKFPQGRLLDEAQFGLARVLQAQGALDESLTWYKKVAASASSARAGEAQFRLGVLYFDRSQYAEAASAFEDLEQRFPTHPFVPLAELNTGYSYYYLQQYDKAIAHFQEAAKTESQQNTADLWIGLSQKSQDRFDEAVKTFQAALNRQPASDLAEKLTFHLADVELRRHRYQEALQQFQQVAKKWPEGDLADDALYSAAESALQAGDAEQAAALHQQFNERYPQSGLRQVEGLLYGRVLLVLGDQAPEEPAAAKLGLYEQAAEALQKVIDESALEQTQRLGRIQLARAYERLNRDRDVIRVTDELLGSSVSLKPEEQVDVLLLRGHAHLDEKDVATARSDYEEALKLAGDTRQQLQAATGLASVLLQQLEWETLQQTLARIEPLDTDDQHYSRIAESAADVAYDSEQWPIAESFYRLVVEKEPVSAYRLAALSGLAHSRYQQSAFEEAAGLFEELSMAARQDDPLRAHAQYMQALSLRQSGNQEAALALYEKTAKEFSAVQNPAPDAATLELGLQAYRSAKGGARIARELNRYELSDSLYDAAYQELKLQPESEQGELDLLVNEWANLSYQAEKFERSDELYRLLVKERPQSELADDAKLFLAESLRFGDQLDAAREAFLSLANDEQADDFVRQRSLVHLLDLAAAENDWTEVSVLAERMAADFPESDHLNYVDYRRGEALIQTKKYAAALPILQGLHDRLLQNLDGAPEWWPQAWLLLAEANFGNKDYDAMTAVLTDLRERKPESPLLYRADALLGRSLENQARFDEARAAYQRVVDSDSGRGTETAAECQFRIAESYLKQNNLMEALKEYYKVYAGFDAPRFEAAALFQAAGCDVSLKNWRGAAETYRKLLSEFPDSEFTAKAQKQLEEIERTIPELKSDRS